MFCGITAYFFSGILPSSAIFFLQILGYISMPFFAQSLVEGFFLTRNTYSYFLRLALNAYFAQGALLLVYLLWPGSPHPARLNIVFSWLISMAVLIGLELLISLPRDRIASMNLLNANQATNSTRYDVIITSEDANNLPSGLKVPKWPKSTFHAIALVLFALCMILVTLLPLTMTVISVFCVLIFYFLHRWKIRSRILTALIVYSAFAVSYTYSYYRMTGIFSWEWTSLAGFLLCLLIPDKRRRKKRLFYRLLYLVYPVSIVLIAAVAFLLSR